MNLFQFIRFSFWKCCPKIYTAVPLLPMGPVNVWDFGCEDAQFGENQNSPLYIKVKSGFFSVLRELLTCVST